MHWGINRWAEEEGKPAIDWSKGDRPTSELNSGGIPLSAELVNADSICVGDRIIRHQRIEKVVRTKDMNDDTLEFRVFSESRGYKDVLFSSQDTILKLIKEGADC